MMAEYTTAYFGGRKCERCKTTAATRCVRVPDPREAPAYVCRGCADFWNAALDEGIRRASRKMAAEFGGEWRWNGSGLEQVRRGS